MDLAELRLQNLGIDKGRFGRIFSFVDFGNMNYWYEKDQRDISGNTLSEGEKLIVEVSLLASFVSSFSKQQRFYYGWDARRKASWHLAIKAEQCGFIKNTKPIQFIRHYLSNDESEYANGEFLIHENSSGKYVEIPKGNFDVEISVDAMRLFDKYDTFCLFSGDSDFAYLARFLKQRGKKGYRHGFWADISYP